MLKNGDANSVETRVLVFLELLEFRVGKIYRVRIERKEHPLDCRLGGFFVIDIAGVVIGNGRYSFAVIVFNIVRGTGGCDGALRGRGSPGPSGSALHTTNDAGSQNNGNSNCAKSFVHLKFVRGTRQSIDFA